MLNFYFEEMHEHILFGVVQSNITGSKRGKLNTEYAKYKINKDVIVSILP